MFLGLALSKLEKAEELAYSEAFNAFGVDEDGFVRVENTALRNFVLQNSDIAVEDLDRALLFQAVPRRGLNLAAFLQVLANNAASDEATVAQFNELRRNASMMSR